jgi:hypothetical protein
MIYFMRESTSIQVLRELHVGTGEIGFACHTRLNVVATYPKTLALVTSVKPDNLAEMIIHAMLKGKFKHSEWCIQKDNGPWGLHVMPTHSPGSSLILAVIDKLQLGIT